jgi:hypothetical protein
LPPEGDEPSWHELNAAIRAQVASEVAPSPWWRTWRWLAPIGLLAAAATIALVVVRSSPSETPREQTALRDAGVVAPIAQDEPPREPAPAVWLDGEPVEIDDLDIDAIELPALRAYTLTEQLDLDEATAAKLFPALAKWDDELDKLLVARADIQRRLEATTKASKDIDKLIDEAVANQRALWDAEAQRLAQLRKILTPAQTARVLVVLPAMERKIQNQLRRAAQKRPAATGELPANPYEDRDAVKNPFDTARPKLEKQRARRRGGEFCDPFVSPHGCAK